MLAKRTPGDHRLWLMRRSLAHTIPIAVRMAVARCFHRTPKIAKITSLAFVSSTAAFVGWNLKDHAFGLSSELFASMRTALDLGDLPSVVLCGAQALGTLCTSGAMTILAAVGAGGAVYAFSPSTTGRRTLMRLMAGALVMSALSLLDTPVVAVANIYEHKRIENVQRSLHADSLVGRLSARTAARIYADIAAGRDGQTPLDGSAAVEIKAAYGQADRHDRRAIETLLSAVAKPASWHAARPVE